MNGKAGAAALANCLDKLVQVFKAVQIINAKSVFDRDRNACRCPHFAQAFRHKLRVRHQAGADHIVLYPIAWAAHIQVYLVITPLFGHAGALSELTRVAATQLKRDWMLTGVIVKMACGVAMDQRACRNHFGVQQSVV
jgi:hypothetical protein